MVGLGLAITQCALLAFLLPGVAPPRARPAAVPSRVPLCPLMEEASWPPPQLQFAAEIAAGAPCLTDAVVAVERDAEALMVLQESDEAIRHVADYLRPSAQQQVRLALEVALVAHHGQFRRSGEPFVTHPVAVAVILARSNMEGVTVASGLLHDTVEDTAISFDELEHLFGTTVRRIVEGETKVSKLPKMVRSQMAEEGMSALDKSASKVEEQVENLRSMFIAMADDWRIVSGAAVPARPRSCARQRGCRMPARAGCVRGARTVRSFPAALDGSRLAWPWRVVVGRWW